MDKQKSETLGFRFLFSNNVCDETSIGFGLNAFLQLIDILCVV